MCFYCLNTPFLAPFWRAKTAIRATQTRKYFLVGPNINLRVGKKLRLFKKAPT